MTRAIKAIAIIPSETAPNSLGTAKVAAAAAAKVDGIAVLFVLDGIPTKDLAQSGADRLVIVEGVSSDADGDVLAAAFVAAIETQDIDPADTAFLLPFGTLEQDIAAGIAHRLGGAIMGKCAEIQLSRDGCVVERPAYGGRATATVRATRGPFIGIVRPSLLAEPEAKASSLETVTISVLVAAPQIERIDHEGPPTLPLENAKVIVAGGRGMGGAESFHILEEIAGEIGGVVGCSLPAADAGWRPISQQIGQSGKFVNPDLYIAVGISGMSQHLAGIGESVSIVAVNNDPDASIWQVAEAGVVADWKIFLPKLLDALRVA
jgi:electron transfer flavoprotein alpha subunit